MNLITSARVKAEKEGSDERYLTCIHSGDQIEDFYNKNAYLTIFHFISL